MSEVSFKIGTDPELFVKKGRAYESAHGLVPGTKAEPYPVTNGAVQVDGMALEFNTDPAETAEEFVHNVKSVMGQLEAMVPDYVLVPEPIAKFSQRVLKAQPAEALDFGCDPDYNAYTTELNQIDANPEEINFRTGAGHIHVGWCEGVDPNHPDHFEACYMAARQLDYYLGLPSLLWDKCSDRRKLYGKAGAFRPKPYGMEYRTLSNAWLKDDKLIEWVFNATQMAMADLVAGDEAYKIHGEMARKVIDDGKWSDNRERIIRRLCGLLEIGEPV